MVPENTLLLYSLAVVWFVILMLVFPGISVNWNSRTLKAVLIDMIPENTLLSYSLTVVWFLILPGIPINSDTPFKSF